MYFPLFLLQNDKLTSNKKRVKRLGNYPGLYADRVNILRANKNNIITP